MKLESASKNVLMELKAAANPPLKCEGLRILGFRVPPIVRLLPLILVLSAFLRLYLALSTTYVWDEEREWIPLAESISLEWGNVNLPIHRLHPALPAYFIEAGSLLLGKNPVGFRLFNVTAGVLTIIVAARIAHSWAGYPAALWTATLLAFNEYHVHISVLAIEKSFSLLFASLSSYAFIRFLHSEKVRYLFATAGMAGLAFLTIETSVLLLPVFFATMALSGYRHWLKRKEPYLACALFLVVIAPNIYVNWNAANELEVSYSDQLSRVGNLGITPYYLRFYFRDAIHTLNSFIGRDNWDPASEYASMNSLFGAILLGSVSLVTLLNARKLAGGEDPIMKFLLLFFGLVFGFFFLILPGTPAGNLDPIVWFWVDMTILPAVLLTAYFLSSIRGIWRFPVYAAVGAAVLYALVAAGTTRFGMRSMQIGFAPEFLWPPEGQMVEVETKFNRCAICDAPSKVELVDVTIIHSDGRQESGLLSPDVQGADVGTDDRELRLRAVTEKNSNRWVQRSYRITYRLTDSSGQSRLMIGTVYVPGSASRIFTPRPWTR